METLKNRHEIKLKKPARYWDDGLPIGNGRLGAMVMGKVNEETIYLNEETIWYGRDLDRKNPDTGKYLDQIRELLFAGEVEKAQFLAKMAITSTPKYMNPYQPAGDLRICMYHHKGKAEQYERRLLLEEAVAADRKVQVIDLTDVFIGKDGKIEEKLFSDGLHPNCEGYKRIAKVLRKYVMQ